jgi:hypothetical protein
VIFTWISGVENNNCKWWLWINMNSKVRLSHSNDGEVTSLLRCDIVPLIEECLMYQNTVFPSSSGSSSPRRIQISLRMWHCMLWHPNSIVPLINLGNSDTTRWLWLYAYLPKCNVLNTKNEKIFNGSPCHLGLNNLLLILMT